MKTNKIETQELLSKALELCLLIKEDLNTAQKTLNKLKTKVSDLEKRALKGE